MSPGTNCIMSYISIEKVLEAWNYAGEQPYQVLIDLGWYDNFLQYLQTQRYKINDGIYRGTRRHSELEIGDKLTYHYPTSWSLDIDVASEFISDIPNSVILVFNYTQSVIAIPNHKNTYSEHEVILYPTE